MVAGKNVDTIKRKPVIDYAIDINQDHENGVTYD